MGPSASETKTAQSVALSPQCYHIRTSLAGKFLIYAVIFSLFSPSSSSCRCWYRQGFNIQMPVCAGVCTCTMYTHTGQYRLFPTWSIAKRPSTINSVKFRRVCALSHKHNQDAQENHDLECECKSVYKVCANIKYNAIV